MHLRSAELLLGDVFVGHCFDERRAAERHRSNAFDHGDEVGEAGNVGRAGGAGADHGRDLRDDAAHMHLLAEEMAGAGEERNVSGWLVPGSMRAPAESMNHTIGKRPRSAIWRRRVTFSSPV